MHKQVVSEVVNHDICIGCGICSGVCPSSILEMGWRSNGDLAPSVQGSCPPLCSVCLDVCPFEPTGKALNEDDLAKQYFAEVSGIQYTYEVGYHLASYVAYSNVHGHRANGASGGMATWLLEQMLLTGLVDAVACVGRGSDSDHLFQFELVDDVQQLRKMAGSRYYPVDMGKVIAAMHERGKDRRFAVVGLPCALKGLRQAMVRLPRLRKRIAFTLGLVCGHLPNRYYTEYLSKLSGIASNDIKTVDYRIKRRTKRAGNFNFCAIDKNDRQGKFMAFSSPVGRAWTHRYFQHNACNYCDDVFAEVADVTLMDAWLPEYEWDTQGHSLVLVRHPQVKELLQKGKDEKSCTIEPIDIEQVIASQKTLVDLKKVEIGGRLYAAKQRGEQVPPKRIEPSEAIYKKHAPKIQATRTVQNLTKQVWLDFRSRRLWHFHLLLFIPTLPLKVQYWRSRLQRVTQNPFLLLKLLPLGMRSKLPQAWKNKSFGINKDS